MSCLKIDKLLCIDTITKSQKSLASSSGKKKSPLLSFIHYLISSYSQKDVDKCNTIGHFWQYFEHELRTQNIKKTYKCKHGLHLLHSGYITEGTAEWSTSFLSLSLLWTEEKRKKNEGIAHIATGYPVYRIQFSLLEQHLTWKASLCVSY